MANFQAKFVTNTMAAAQSVNKGKVPDYIRALMAIATEVEVEINHRVKDKVAEELKTRDDLIEKQDTRIAELEQKNVELVKQNTDLVYQLDGASQYNRRDNGKVFGIPYTKDEKPNEIVKEICKHLDVPLTDNDISVAHRLFTKDKRVEGDTPAIIVKFARRDKKNEFYNAKKKLKTSPMAKYPNLAIYEDLTPLRNRMLYQLRNRKDETTNKKKYMYTWSREGRIYWRTESEAQQTPQPKPHAVNTPDDMKTLGFSDVEIYNIVNNIRPDAPTPVTPVGTTNN